MFSYYFQKVSFWLAWCGCPIAKTLPLPSLPGHVLARCNAGVRQISRWFPETVAKSQENSSTDTEVIPAGPAWGNASHKVTSKFYEPRGHNESNEHGGGGCSLVKRSDNSGLKLLFLIIYSFKWETNYKIVWLHPSTAAPDKLTNLKSLCPCSRIRKSFTSSTINSSRSSRVIWWLIVSSKFHLSAKRGNKLSFSRCRGNCSTSFFKETKNSKHNSKELEIPCSRENPLNRSLSRHLVASWISTSPHHHIWLLSRRRRKIVGFLWAVWSVSWIFCQKRPRSNLAWWARSHSALAIYKSLMMSISLTLPSSKANILVVLATTQAWWWAVWHMRTGKTRFSACQFIFTWHRHIAIPTPIWVKNSSSTKSMFLQGTPDHLSKSLAN